MTRISHLFLCLGLLSLPLYAQKAKSRSQYGGPDIDSRPVAGVTPHQVLKNMFQAIENLWFVPAYDRAQHLNWRMNVDATLPSRAIPRAGKAAVTGGSVSFDVDVEGISTPSGNLRMEMDGDLGEVQVTATQRRTLVASQDFKSFSDTPKRTRSKNANLKNYSSYLRRHLADMRNAVLESGKYRTSYKGSGLYQGQRVDIVRVMRPSAKLRGDVNKRKPINLRKLWTFWQDGSYEIWIYQKSKLPAAVFYTNAKDNIFANFTIDYDNDWLPKRMVYTNNSVDAEGSGDLVFNYDQERMLSGVSFKFDGNRGISLRLDAILIFGGLPPNDAFRAIPPFGFRKINRDHLRLMILTQISGGLLKLRKHGLNVRNFKF